MPTHLAPPESICLLRLSALGDVTHVLPLLRDASALGPLLTAAEYAEKNGLAG